MPAVLTTVPDCVTGLSKARPATPVISNDQSSRTAATPTEMVSPTAKVDSDATPGGTPAGGPLFSKTIRPVTREPALVWKTTPDSCWPDSTGTVRYPVSRALPVPVVVDE